MVTADENIVEEMEEFLDSVREDELHPVYDDVILNHSQGPPITSPIVASQHSQPMPKEQSKHYNYSL